MTEQRESPVPPPITENRDDRDWEERRRVALEAWSLGRKLAAERNREPTLSRRAYRRRAAAR
jgi:hypothetical protein